MNILALCAPAVAVAYRGMGVSEAARVMHEHHVGSLDALKLVRRRGVRRAPVVTRGGALAGIATLDDLLCMLVSQLDDLANTISTELSVEPVLRA